MKSIAFRAAAAAVFGALAFPALADPPGDVPPEPVLHVVMVGLEVGNVEVVTIAGPFEPGTTFEIFDITTVNRGADAGMVQYRMLQPDVVSDPPASADCIGGGTVIDEIMRVAVPARSSLHQTFPEGLTVPGQLANSIGDVVEADPTEHVCLTAFLPANSIFPMTAGDDLEGRIGLRIKFPE